MNANRQKVITIDGPSASGKGTVAALVAQKLGFAYLDSGALYRLCALAAINQNTSLQDIDQIVKIAQTLPVHFDGNQIFLNGKQVTDTIRQEEIGLAASQIAAYPQVREALLTRQRKFLTAQGLVTDGRDMGSVVFPHARLKVFLTATAPIRAQRRFLQLEKMGKPADYNAILKDIERRDTADQNRSVAPLKHYPDAQFLDTSDININESVQKVLNWYHQTMANN